MRLELDINHVCVVTINLGPVLGRGEFVTELALDPL